MTREGHGGQRAIDNEQEGAASCDPLPNHFVDLGSVRKSQEDYASPGGHLQTHRVGVNPNTLILVSSVG